MTIVQEQWGTIDNQEVLLFTLTNNRGLIVKITNYGGIITSVLMPDSKGNLHELTLGFDTLDGYTNEAYANAGPYFGAIIGRYGNRIANGKFTLNGKEYVLAQNNGPNNLHGGINGFHKKVWEAEIIDNKHLVGVNLKTTSPHMEEGFPGKLNVFVTYSLTDDGELIIEYGANTDMPTHVNLTNHAYFNLTGCARNVEGHQVQIFADYFTPTNDLSIPLGELKAVKDTEMDFTEIHTIGERIDNVQGRGYDHNYVVNGEQGELRIAALVTDPQSGRCLEVYTTEPGIQFYTGNYLDGSLKRGNITMGQRWGFCLEAQHYPDSPNQSQFPTTILQPDETYHQTTVYKFGYIE